MTTFLDTGGELLPSQQALPGEGSQLKPPQQQDHNRSGQRARNTERQRENQRVCRARRKERVDELQRRVDEYDRLGVQATLEMQQVTRRVNWVNSRLRALLASKGVPEAEVQAWLRQDPEPVAAVGRLPPMITADRAAASASIPPLPVRATSNEQQRMPLLSYSACRPAPLSTSSSSPRDDFSPASRPSTSLGEANTSVSSTSQYGTTEPGPSLSGRVANCCSSGTETSCEVAAAILANMQGHGDTSRAKAALGCEGETDCTVKNTRVLELLDEAA